MDCIKKSFPCGERKRLLICVISTFIFGLAAHAYGLLNNIFSHDSLNALYADSTENLAKIAVGRFLVPVVRMFRGSIAIPWLIGLIALVLISLSVYLTVKIFDVKSNAAAVLISGFMVTNVTVTAITATYVHELDVDMFALFMSCLAAYFWKKGKKIPDLISVALFLLLSMAIYQSYAEVTVTLMILVLILNAVEGENVKNVFIKGIKGVVPVGIAAVLYFALNKLLCFIFKTDVLERVDITAEYNDTVLHRFVMLFKGIAVSFLTPAGIYSVILIAAVNIVIIVGIIIAIIALIKKHRINAGGICMILMLAVMLPFGLNGVSVLSHIDVHDVMKYSFWFVYVFAIVVFFRYFSLISENKAKTAIKVVSAVCAAIILWNNILVSNAAYLKKDLEHGVTLTTMNRVIDDLEDFEGFKAGETEVAFVGFVNGQKTYPGFETVARIAGLRNTMATGALKHTEYYDPYNDFFKYFMNYPMKLSEKDYREDPTVQVMPSYPEDGYIRWYGDTLIVKLGGNEPDDLGPSDIEKSIKSIINMFS